MKQVLKRALALMLTLVLCVGMVPVAATAEDSPTTGTIDAGEMTVEGTNTFGAMLAEDIEESETAAEDATAEYEAGYTVTALEIVDGVATVTYDTLETANLVVAIYSEDGKQLITSGKTEVVKEDTVATVIIDGEMPTYFYAEAFLLDSYDFSPLCPSYDTPLYTQEMQELLASTTEDYEEELVLNLDEDETTNFAVYNEAVIRIPFVEGVNTVASVDDDAMTYVIENADEQFTALQQGDIVAYEYGEDELLIAKVDTLTVDGTTVTIVGADAEMEEIFSHVKVEGTGNTEDVQVDTTTMAEGVTYNGLVSDEVQTFAWGGGGESKKAIDFHVDYDEGVETKYLDAKIKFKGSIKFEIPVSFEYYISLEKQFVEFKVKPTVTVGITLSGKVTGKIPFGSFTVPIAGVINVGFKPHFVIGIEDKIELNAKFMYSFGMKYDSSEGFKNLTTKPQTDLNVKATCVITIGVDWTPTVDIIGGTLVKLSLEVFTGIEVEISNSLKATTAEKDEWHACEGCLKIEPKFKAELGIELSFLDCNWLTFSRKFGAWRSDLGEMYYSDDLGQFGFGECPNILYKITFVLSEKEKSKTYIKDAAVAVTDEDGNTTELGTTNKKGIVRTYLPVGNYTVSAEIDGKTYIKNYQITESGKLMFYQNEATKNTPFGDLSAEELADHGAVKDSGTCGDAVYWQLHNDGFLYIYGEGAMDGCSGNTQPWNSYKANIKTVHIGDGVTSIGSLAFDGCTSLMSVVISDSVTMIGGWAFDGCTSLASVKFGNSVTGIEVGAFDNCTSLVSVVIPDSVTSIGLCAFSYCTSLESVVIPDSVTSLMGGEFYGCTSLKSVVIPDSVTVIWADMFYGCKSLTSIVIPDSVTSIKNRAFRGCTSLKSVYYTGTQAQWNAISIDGDNGPLTSATKYYNYVSSEADYDAVYGGEVETITPVGGAAYKIASFDGLMAGWQYTLLVLTATDAEDVLGASNLLYIKQGVADESGTLAFEYIPRADVEVSYVMVCGASEKDLNDAEITFPLAVGLDDVQAVEPTVVYDGEVLTEGVDYVVVGTVSYTEAGEYTCYVRGIYDYTGLVTCPYTVCESAQTDTARYAVTSDTTLTMMEHLADSVALFVPATMDGKTVTAIHDGVVSDGVHFIVYGGSAADWSAVQAESAADKIVYFTYTADGALLGDLNGDTVMDTADIRAMLVAILERTLTDAALVDINADSKANSSDVRGMLRVLAYA